jgi:hypothetical protein
MELVSWAVARQARQEGGLPLLITETGTRREVIPLPSDADAPEAAAYELTTRWTHRPPRLRRVAVVWRAELDREDGNPLPLRYVRVQVTGEPTSSLLVQHYSATPRGERPLGEPELVDQLDPLPLPQREVAWWRSSPIGGATAGVFAGIVLADGAVWIADRFGSATRHRATVTDTYVEEPARHDGHYHVLARTDAGEPVNFDNTETQRLYEALDPGQRIEVAISDVTGRPVAVDTARRHYDLVDFHPLEHLLTWGPLVLATTYVLILPGRIRNRWGLPMLAGGALLYGLRLLGII